MELTVEQWKQKYEQGMALLKADLHDARKERDWLRLQNNRLRERLEECTCGHSIQG